MGGGGGDGVELLEINARFQREATLRVDAVDLKTVVRRNQSDGMVSIEHLDL
jgi:hypothetical protein